MSLVERNPDWPKEEWLYWCLLNQLGRYVLTYKKFGERHASFISMSGAIKVVLSQLKEARVNYEKMERT